jgi:hypothetical protein
VADDQPDDAEQLARFCVAVTTGRLPRDVGHWALERLQGLGLSRDVRARRNALLRAASLKLHGTRWRKARRIWSHLQGAHDCTSLDKLEVARLCTEALWIDPTLRGMSFQQVYRILKR